MKPSSCKPGSQQEHLRLLSSPSSSSADISANDRLFPVQLLPPFPHLEQDVSACKGQTQWVGSAATHHPGSDSKAAAVTTSTNSSSSSPSSPPPPLLLPSRGWPGTEVTIYLPSSPDRQSAAGHIELVFGQIRVSVRSDTFADPSGCSREMVRIMAYAPFVPRSSSVSLPQHGCTQPSLIKEEQEEEEEYTVQVVLYCAQSSYAVGTFTYLPSAAPITIPRPIALPPPLWSSHSSYKEFVAYPCQTPGLLQHQQYHGGSTITEYSHEMAASAAPSPGPCIFSPLYGIFSNALPISVPRAPTLEAAQRHIPADQTVPPISTKTSRSATRKLAKRKAPAVRHPQAPHSDASPSVALYHPYPNVEHRVDFKVLGDTDRLVDGWSQEEIACGRRILRFWREDDAGANGKMQQLPEVEHARSTTVQCAFEVVENLEQLQQHQQEQQQNYGLVERTSSPLLPRSVFISCIRSNDKHYVTSVDLIALIEMLTGTRFDIAGKNRIRRNLEGFRPITASKYSNDTFQLFQLIMGFGAPKPRNIEKDIKIFSWGTLPFALKKLVIKHYSSSRANGKVIHAAPLSSSFCFKLLDSMDTATAAAAAADDDGTTKFDEPLARRDEEVRRLLRHRDPASPETPPITPITPSDDQFVYKRSND